jgi:hypothetical protein
VGRVSGSMERHAARRRGLVPPGCPAGHKLEDGQQWRRGKFQSPTEPAMFCDRKEIEGGGVCSGDVGGSNLDLVEEIEQV